MEFVPGQHAEVPAAGGSAAAWAGRIARRRGRRRTGGRALPRRPSSRSETGEYCADDRMGNRRSWTSASHASCRATP